MTCTFQIGGPSPFPIKKDFREDKCFLGRLSNNNPTPAGKKEKA